MDIQDGRTVKELFKPGDPNRPKYRTLLVQGRKHRTLDVPDVLGNMPLLYDLASIIKKHGYKDVHDKIMYDLLVTSQGGRPSTPAPHIPAKTNNVTPIQRRKKP